MSSTLFSKPGSTTSACTRALARTGMPWFSTIGTMFAHRPMATTPMPVRCRLRDREPREQHEREQHQRGREVTVETRCDDLTGDAADEQAPLVHTRPCEASATRRQGEPDRESEGDSRQRQDHATNVTIEHYVPGDGLRSGAVRRVRRRRHDHDQSARAAQRAVVAGDDRAARRLRGREGRRRRACRRAHRRGRQGVLRRRRPHAGWRPTPAGPTLHDARGELARLFRDMWELGKPIIARVRGYALAGGFGLCLACDLVVAADDAQFGTPEIDVGLWPYMITVPLMRSMPPKKALELMMTGRRVDADEAERIGFVTPGRAGRPSSTTPVDELAATLASKSPLDHEARAATRSTRVWDQIAEDALRLLQPMLTITTATEDAAEGIAAFAEKRAAAVEGTADGTTEKPNPCTTGGRWSTTSRARKEQRARDGRRRARRAPARARQAAGPRAPRPAARRRARSSSTALLADHMDPSLGRPRFARRRRRRHRHRRDRRPARRGRRVRLHRDGRLDGRRSARRRRRACASSCCASASRSCGCSTRPARASSRRAARRSPARARCSGSRSRCRGVVPQVGAMLGHCAAGTAYIPALDRLRADGEGHVVDGARRPSPREGGDRRGRHRGGDGRLRGAHQGLGRRRPRGGERRGVPRDGARTTCRSSRSTTRSAPPVVDCDDPVDRRCEELYDIVPTAPRRAYDMRKVVDAVVDDGDVL